MARKRTSILDDLVVLPWWVTACGAVVVYLVLKYWVPAHFAAKAGSKHAPDGLAMNALAQVAPTFATLFAIVLGFVSFISLIRTIAESAKAKSTNKGQESAAKPEFHAQIGTEHIREMPWHEFEKTVGHLYRSKGFEVTQKGGNKPDGGVDLIAEKNGEKLLIQCKHWKTWKVGVKVIRELYGVVTADPSSSGGIVITSGTFTEEALEFAKGKQLELIDGTKLLSMFSDLAYMPPMQDEEIIKHSESPKCPVCGGQMVIRTTKKKLVSGNQFWGCTYYPRCRGIRPLK
ncbi:MAG TPA: DUF2034 domain-containing protein [Deltaproteobacteria bacterium]|jgi:restriction system protein|nr:DUF2034 domain-containing protein [Deltaproteobacteria bacterium]HOI06038.1 DUF2034 domain-containing protein [Deltaproteobacteria bacterium]